MDKERPLSWSSISGFHYNKEEWFKRYILKEENPPSAEMLFGKKFADSLEDNTCEVKELVEKLPYKKEHKFLVMFGKVPLIGYADDFDDKKFVNLGEVKTGVKKWDQKRADGHGQFDMYLLMNYITNKVKPEDVKCCLHWVPTTRKETGDFEVVIDFVRPIQVVSIETKRTMRDILAFGDYINKTLEEMESFVCRHE